MASSPVRVANIGPKERHKRLVSGLVLLAASVIIAAAMMAGSISRGWRVLLFLPLWGAALGVFQASDST
jgi:hypothetical protein